MFEPLLSAVVKADFVYPLPLFGPLPYWVLDVKEFLVATNKYLLLLVALKVQLMSYPDTVQLIDGPVAAIALAVKITFCTTKAVDKTKAQDK